MLISVVVPCYNEATVLPNTHQSLVKSLDPLCAFEIVYVDDGSSDETPFILRQFAQADDRVKVVRLSRNFGQQVATTAGLEHASGDAVVVMDADLQDPPELLRELYEKWREGWQVVYGERQTREGEARFKRWSAALFYRLLHRLFALLPLDTGDFRLLDRVVVDAVLRMPERDRFLRGMISWAGFRQIAVPYQRAARQSGGSKYSLFRMLGLAVDAILSFSVMPLRLALWIGFGSLTLAFAGIVYAVVLRLFFAATFWIRGWASLFVAVLFMGGVQLVTLGIMGEYLGRIYGEVKQRPLYFVSEKLGFKE